MQCSRNRSPRTKSLWPASLWPAVALAVAASAAAWPGRAASEGPATRPAADETPTVGPIAYYVANCARCHGAVTEPYLGLDHPKRGAALKDAIAQMADGPGNAPLDAPSLKQQTALHEAIFGHAPFVWLDPAAGERVTGEVLPGTSLAFEADGRREAVSAVDNQFEFSRRAGTLIATRDKTSVRLPFKGP